MKLDLNDNLIALIRNHITITLELVKHYYKGKNIEEQYDLKKPFDVGMVGEGQEWTVLETEDRLHIHTSMDNFNMYGFLKYIGIPKEKIIVLDDQNLEDWEL
jgi:hypothetical protein